MPGLPALRRIDKAYYLEPKQGTRRTRTGRPTYRRVWNCAQCREQFSVLVGTIFEDSETPLAKWLYAIHLLCPGKNGVSGSELQRSLGIAYRSAWFVAHRIRYATARPPLVDKLQGIVEADETYIGGRTKSGERERGAPNKTPVVTLVERDGEARSQVMKHVTGDNLGKVHLEHVEQPSVLMANGLPAYHKPGKDFTKHEAVDHAAGQYVRGGVHVNTTQGYSSQLKCSTDGTRHHVSEQHLPRYLAEFDYRCGGRKVSDDELTEWAIRQTIDKRWQYRQPPAEQVG